LVEALKEKYQFQLAEKDTDGGSLRGDWQLDQILLALEKRKTNLLARLNQIQDAQRELRETKSGLFAREIHENEKSGRGAEEGLAMMNNQFQEFERRLTGMQKKVDGLTRKLAGASLEIFEKEKALGDKEERMSALEKELSETKQRLLLVQKVIQEKDNEARQLEEKVQKIQTADEAGADKEKSRLDVLEEKFQDLNERYTQMEADLRKKNQKILKLQQTLAVKEETIDEVKKDYVSSRDQARTAAGMVEIYRGRLIDTRDELKTKEGQLEDLRKKLRFLDSEVNVGKTDDSSRIAAEALGLLRRYNHFESDALKQTKTNIRKLNEGQKQDIFPDATTP